MKVEYVCLANSEQELENNLLRSFNIADMSLTIIWGASRASKALYDTINTSKADYLVILHQDVFLPPGWMQKFESKLDELNVMDSNWAVAGPFGRSEELKKNVGQVWSSSLGAVAGSKVHESVEVKSLDELALIINRKSGVNFDPDLPDFHLYGTDICLNAKAMGLRSYALQLPLVHNDKFKPGLGLGFLKSYFYMRKKWKKILPIITPITIIKRDLVHISKGYYYLHSSKQSRKLNSRCHIKNPEFYWEEALTILD